MSEAISLRKISAGTNKASEASKNTRLILFGSLIGNVMEFYDFMIFAFLAQQITSLFFPVI